MRKKNYKGKCEKRKLNKCQEVCKTYDEIQYAYANLLEQNAEVKEFKCNVVLSGVEDDAYTSDFVCVKSSDELMIRECVRRKLVTKPMTVYNDYDLGRVQLLINMLLCMTSNAMMNEIEKKKRLQKKLKTEECCIRNID